MKMFASFLLHFCSSFKNLIFLTVSKCFKFDNTKLNNYFKKSIFKSLEVWFGMEFKQ